MTIESALLTRSESSCELYRSTDDLQIFAVPPFESAEPDYCLLICRICDDHLEGSSSMDVNYWRCLNDTMWSQVRPVQIMTWRLLTKLNSEPWAQDLLDILYLEDDTLALAKTGTFDGDAPTVKHKDSNGALLKADDSVTLIKDLNVKGVSFTAKRGTAVRNISLVENNSEQLEGRINGTQIIILTKFVKRVN